MSSSDSETSDSEVELQDAFVDGRLKPGLNTVNEAPKQFTNNATGLKQKLNEIKLNLPWIELLSCTNKEAPLAPELAVQMLVQTEKRQNQMKNNKKLPQFAPSEDPVLNDFKRETLFHRQAQATVLEALPKLKAMGVPTKRPDDFFAEMAKSDEHMQKIRTQLMQKQVQQERSERMKQLRAQRKDGKMLQVQARLDRQKEKKTMLDQLKKVRKGHSKDLGFLDPKLKKSVEKRNSRDKKFGFGGKKRGLKQNTSQSSADIGEYQSTRPKKGSAKFGNKNNKNNRPDKNKRPGKNRRAKTKSRGRK